MTEDKHGSCLCGACSFVLRGAHNWVGHCLCESCRRATASPMTTWIGHPDGAWDWTGAEPRTYASSPGRRRGFCPTCGTPLFYRSADWPDETHFYAALLAPGTQVTPTAVYHAAEALPWHPPPLLP